MILKKLNGIYKEENSFIRAKATHLFYMLIIIFLFSLVMVIRGDITTPHNINLGFYSGLLFPLILLVILFKGNYSLVSNSAALYFTIAITIGLGTGRLDEFDIAYPLLLITFTFFFSSFKNALLITLYSIILITILYFIKGQSQELPGIFIITSLASIVLIFIMATLNTKILNNYVKEVSIQKENLEQQVLARTRLYDQLEKERSLIAFELHDDIAQKMAIIKRYFSNKNSIDEHIVLLENYSSDVIKRVRYLSRMLKAPDNPNVSFKDYLETLFSDFNVLSDFKLNRRTIGLNALILQPAAALHIYRIIQEILTNSRIHSEATEIDFLMVYSHPTLNIKYKDNGKGFDPYLVYRKGIGLDSIKYRLEILNGDYKLNSAEGEGTDISIDIPVELCEIS